MSPSLLVVYMVLTRAIVCFGLKNKSYVLNEIDRGNGTFWINCAFSKTVFCGKKRFISELYITINFSSLCLLKK